MNRFEKPARGTRKSYSVLEGRKKMPTKYELTSTKLLYYPDRQLSIANPVIDWHESYGPNSHLRMKHWDDFCDPSSLTYSDYIKARYLSEIHLDKIAALHQLEDHIFAKDPLWVQKAEENLAPTLFPCHGLQMVSSYLGSMALSGKISICFGFQAADEMRKVHHIAERLAQIRQIVPTFADKRQTIWEKSPAWQPLRKAIESLLVTYDWLDTFVGLNLCLKPLLTQCYFNPLQDEAQKSNDQITFYKLAALREDDDWHLSWAMALLKFVVTEGTENYDAVHTSFQRWQKRFSASLGINNLFPEPQNYFTILENKWEEVEAFLGSKGEPDQGRSLA